MHVLVTGANGFIGRHVVQRLLASGKQVTACLRTTAMAPVFADAGDSLHIYRVESLASIAGLTAALEGVDAVIHLAGRAHVMQETAADPLLEFRKANVAVTESLATAAASMGVARFIYVSSITVNGGASSDRPFCADDPPACRDPYGQSKWEAEERLREIATEHHMEWVIVRPPLVYGPGVRGNFLELFRHVARGFPLPLGSLHNHRSLVGVFNFSDFLTLLLEHPAAANNRFVVADGDDISTPDLIRHIAEALRCRPRLVPCPEALLRGAGSLLGKTAAVERLCSSLTVDRQKVREVLGWSSPVTLKWELSRTAEWYVGEARAS